MESLKFDLRGATDEVKKRVVDKLKAMGYQGEPYPSNFYFYTVYASGYCSKHGYSLSYGNNMKTFFKNKGREVEIDDFLKD